MSVTAFIRRCLEIGMPVDMALAAAEAFEAEAPAAMSPADERRLEKQRARQARYEQRKRQNASVTSENVSLTSEPSNDAKEGPQTPKKITPSPPLKGGISPKIPASEPEKPKTTEPQKALTSWVSEIWQQAPLTARQRSSQRETANALRAAVRGGDDPQRIADGIAAYYASPDVTKEGGAFAKGVHRAIQNRLWELYEPQPERSPADDDPWPGRLLKWRTAAYWNSEWGPKPGRPGYRGPDVQDQAA